MSDKAAPGLINGNMVSEGTDKVLATSYRVHDFGNTYTSNILLIQM